jgi:hypothetical protein
VLERAVRRITKYLRKRGALEDDDDGRTRTTFASQVVASLDGFTLHAGALDAAGREKLLR